MSSSSERQRAAAGKASKQRSGLSVVELLVVVTILGLLAGALFLTPVRSGRSTAQRTQCLNNLRNIALALINYHENYQALPPAYTVDATGRRLHSWRTLILPYLDQKISTRRLICRSRGTIRRMPPPTRVGFLNIVARRSIRLRITRPTWPSWDRKLACCLRNRGFCRGLSMIDRKRLS